MSRERKVIVPHLPTRPDAATHERVPSVNLNPASKYGELLILSKDFIPFDTMQTAIDAATMLLDTDADSEDYLVCVGDPVITAAALAYMNELFGYVNVLRWDRGALRYEVIRVTL